MAGIIIVCLLSIIGLALLLSSLVEEEGMGVAGVAGVAGFICIALIISMYCFRPETDYQYNYSYNIYAIEDNLTIRGGMFYIEQDDEYYYLSDYKDGKKMYSVYRNSAYIVEDKNTKPHIEVYVDTIKSNNGFVNWLYKCFYGEEEYKIVVPEKTLTTDFNIDMKS